MNIRETLLEEHSKSQCKKIVSYIGADKKKFAELMKAFFDGPYRVTQRAAWPMNCCVEDHPGIIGPYFKRLVNLLQKPGVHPAVTRNITRLLQYTEIPNRYQGKIMTICFEFISSETVPPAVKADSLTVLQKLSKAYPDIRNELEVIIKDRWDLESPAFKSRARIILKTL